MSVPKNLWKWQLKECVLLLQCSLFQGSKYLKLQDCIYLATFMYSEIYAPLQLPREFNDPNQLTRTLSSWDTLSLWRERLRDCLGSASPSVPPSWENQTRYVYTRICASEKITGDIIHQPFWQDMKGHESLFSIVQNDHNYLWRSVSHCHWCLPLGAMNKPILIALIHAFDIHETHLTESTFQVSSNDIQWQFGIWDWRCSPSNLQVHSELLLYSHFPKQAR